MKAGHAEVMRWGACFALALCFHAAGAAALLARWNDSAEGVVNAPVITIELAPVAAAPDTPPNDLPPDKVLSKLVEPEPVPQTPVEKIEVPPAPQAELQIVQPPKEKPRDKKPKQKQATLAAAPAAAEQRAERAVAPLPGANARNSDSLPSWKSQLVAQIERHKRYDGSERGVAQVAFSVDRSGGVHHARVAASSGSSVLDRDAIAWLERSQPLPPPPADVPGAQIPVTVPLRYNMR